MMNSGMDVPESLAAKLRVYGSQRGRLTFVRAMGEALLVWTCGLMLVSLIDFALRPSRGIQLFSVLAVYVLVAGVIAVRGFIPVFRRRRLVDLALSLEAGLDGRLEERISSAVELSDSREEGVSSWMVNRTVSLAVAELAEINPGEALDRAPLQRAWRRLRIPGALLILLLLVPYARTYLLRAALPGVNLARPSTVHIAVEPGDIRLAAGRSLKILLRTDLGEANAVVEVKWEDGLSEELSMTRRGDDGAFELTVPDVLQNLEYRVCVGAAESRNYSVTVVDPPRLKSVALRITPPEYVGNRLSDVKGGDAEVLSGSLVELSAELSGPESAAAEVLLGNGQRRAMELGNGSAIARFRVMHSVTYGVRLTGKDGLVADAAQQWSIKVVADGKPTAALDGVGLDAGLVGFKEQVVLSVEAADDWGIAECELLMRKGEAEEEKIATFRPQQRGCLKLERTASVDLEALGVAMGQVITLVFRARDLGGQECRSKELTLAVVDGEPAGTAAAAARLRALMARFSMAKRTFAAERHVWTELLRSYRREDSDVQRGTIVVAGQRLRKVFREIHNIAAAVRKEAGLLDAELGSQAFRYGRGLDEWARNRGGMTLRSASEETGKAVERQLLLSTLALVDTCIAEAQDYGRGLGLLTGSLEAEGLVLQCDAARKRADRTVPVLEGYFGWHELEMRKKPGLLARFFRGTKLEGEAVHSAAGSVRIDNFSVPKVGRMNWSARWTGEVRLPTAAKWTFSCRADDGVRLRVAGRELIGKSAWTTQNATSHSGTADLKAGWHAVEIRMFQGSGPSYLRFYRARGKGRAEVVPLGDLRHLPEELEGRQELLAKMSSIPAELLKGADGRLRKDCQTLSSAPATIRLIERDVALDVLKSLASGADAPAGSIAADVKRADEAGWGEVRLEELGAKCSSVASLARHARKAIWNASYHAFASRRYPPGLTLNIVRGMDRLKNRSQSVIAVGKGPRAVDRQRMLALALSAMRAEVRQLRATVSEVRAEYWRRAGDRRRVLGERQNALTAGFHLGDEVEDQLSRIAKATKAHSGKPEASSALNEVVSNALNIARPFVARAANDEAWSVQARVAERATAILDAGSQERAQALGGAVIEQEEARRRCVRRMQELALELRGLGSFATAVSVEKEITSRAGLGISRGLVAKLVSLARKHHKRDWRLGAALLKEAARMDLRRPSADDTAARLAAWALRVELAGDAREWRGAYAESDAYRAVAEDLGALARREKPARSDDVRKIAARIAAIESRAGSKAHENELASGKNSQQRRSEKDRRFEQARRLKLLASEVAAAASKYGRRQGVRDKLAEMEQGRTAEEREGDPARPAERAVAWRGLVRGAEKAARQLAELEGRLAKLDSQDVEARARFSEAEKSIAEALKGIGSEALRQGSELRGENLGKKLAEIGKRLPVRARKIAELGRIAGRRTPADRAGEAHSPAEEKLKDIARGALELAKRAGDAAETAGARVSVARREDDVRSRKLAEAELGDLVAVREKSERAGAEVSGLRRALGKKPERNTEKDIADAEIAAEKVRRGNRAIASSHHNAREAGELADRAFELEAALARAGAALKSKDSSAEARAGFEHEVRIASKKADALAMKAGEVGKRADAAMGRAKQQEARLAQQAAQARRTEELRRIEGAADQVGRAAAEAQARKAVAEKGKLVAEVARKALVAMQERRKDAKTSSGALAAAAAMKAENLRRQLETAAGAAESGKRRQLAEQVGALDGLAQAAARLSEKNKGKAPGAAEAARLAASAKAAAKQAREALKKAAEHQQAKAASRRSIEKADGLAKASMHEAAKAREAAERAFKGTLAMARKKPIEKTGSEIRVPERSLEPAADTRKRVDEAAEHAGRAGELAVGAAAALKQEGKAAKTSVAAAREEWQAARQQAAGRAAEARKGADEAGRLARKAASAGQKAKDALAAAQVATVAAGTKKAAADKGAAAAKAGQARADALKKALSAAKARRQADAAAQVAGAAAGSAKHSAGIAAAAAKKFAAEAGKKAGGGVGQAAKQRLASQELAQAADAEAKQLRQELVAPLADAFKSGKLKARGQAAAAKVGQTGEELAKLVARQEQAAAELVANQRSRERIDKDLAAAVGSAAQAASRAEDALAGGSVETGEQEAGKGELTAEQLQADANNSQRAADTLQNKAEAAWQRAMKLEKQQAGAALGQAAQKARSDALAAQQRAVAAQTQALTKQAAAIAAQRTAMAMMAAGAGDPKLAPAQAMSNLARAEANSAAARKQLAGQQGAPERGSAAQAIQNHRAARAARAELAAAQRAAAKGLRSQLSDLAGKAKAAGSAEAAAAKMASGSGQEGNQESGSSPGQPGSRLNRDQAAAQSQAAAAVRRALGTVQAAPDASSSYRTAANTLAAAAAQIQGEAGSQSQAGNNSGQLGKAAGSSEAGVGMGSTGSGDPGDLTGLDKRQKGEDGAGWARLAERVRKGIRSGGVASFAEEHQEAIRAYFQKLGEVGGKDGEVGE